MNVQTVEDNKDDKIVLVVLKIFSVVKISVSACLMSPWLRWSHVPTHDPPPARRQCAAVSADQRRGPQR